VQARLARSWFLACVPALISERYCVESIEKRGIPRAVLLSIRDYVRLAAPEPEVLRLLGEESKRNRTSALNSREIDKIIKKARFQKSQQ
jgi:hypothetical protein